MVNETFARVFQEKRVKFYRKKKYGTTFVDNVWGPKKN